MTVYRLVYSHSSNCRNRDQNSISVQRITHRQPSLYRHISYTVHIPQIVLWLHQRSKASVVVYTTYTTCLTTAMVYGCYTLVITAIYRGLWSNYMYSYVQLELNTVSHLCNKIDTLFPTMTHYSIQSILAILELERIQYKTDY